ncbi:hypothetical protein E2C01_089670 [Portunus trituberculatus]|uniref:Uncharacterized protein n=1 Tax=Portunus trituberculatus TaxID=210409 RepID=A0A5B7JI34_PORTR|nr:hypothetical protein [Portunus trituberculatus]
MVAHRDHRQQGAAQCLGGSLRRGDSLQSLTPSMTPPLPS